MSTPEGGHTYLGGSHTIGRGHDPGTRVGTHDPGARGRPPGPAELSAVLSAPGAELSAVLGAGLSAVLGVGAGWRWVHRGAGVGLGELGGRRRRRVGLRARPGKLALRCAWARLGWGARGARGLVGHWELWGYWGSRCGDLRVCQAVCCPWES